MNELLNISEQVKTWAKRNEAITLMGKELERIGNIEQYANEAEGRQAAAEAKANEAQLALTEAEAAVQAATAEAERVADSARRQAQALVDTARREAEAERARIVGEAAAEAQAERDRKTAMENETAQAESNRLIALSRLEAAKRELAEVEGKIAAAKEAVKGLFV